MSEHANPSMNPDDDGPTGRVPWELPGELKSLEARLATLTPRDDRLDRERLVFLAGQASVHATIQRPISLFGLKLDGTVWPRAFAAMTAVAAALFVMLLTRLSITGVSSPTPVTTVASGNRPNESRRQLPGESSDMRADALSAGDVRSGDIEQLLESRVEGYAGAMPVDDRDHPTLTPAAWRQMSSSSESAGPPASDSSSVPTIRGINS